KRGGILAYSMPSALATATSAPSARTATASASQSRQNGGRCGLIERFASFLRTSVPRGGTEKGSLLMADRQRERKRRAFSHLALHLDPAAMQLDQLPAQRQSQTRALDLFVRRPDLTELLEDRLLIRGRDAHPGVGDGDLGQALVHRGTHVE